MISELCLLAAAISQATLQGKSDSIPSSHAGDLKSDVSTVVPSGWSWIDSMKENYGYLTAGATEKMEHM